MKRTGRWRSLSHRSSWPRLSEGHWSPWVLATSFLLAQTHAAVSRGSS